MKKLKYYIDWATSTWFGLTHKSGEYSKDWDEKLNQILDTGGYEFNEYVMKYNNYEIWVGNRFLSYGYLYSKDNRRIIKKYRPKVSTMIRLAMIEDEWKKNNIDEDKHTTLYIIKNIEIGE